MCRFMTINSILVPGYNITKCEKQFKGMNTYSKALYIILPVGADFPFNEEILIPDGVNRNSAVIGGMMY